MYVAAKSRTVISTGELTDIAARLAADPDLASCLRAELHTLYRSTAYRHWHEGGTAELLPFRMIAGVSGSVLDELALAEFDLLRVKVNCMAQQVFVTDGVWTDAGSRVFPFDDESHALLAHVAHRKLDRWATHVVDLATGCGHNVLALPGRHLAAGYDINPRAIAFARINRALAGRTGASAAFAVNDIRAGIPPLRHLAADSHVLVLANMPFGPTPAGERVALTTDGGADGLELQIAAFHAVQTLADTIAPCIPIRACFLALTPGSRRAGQWEVVRLAMRRFPDATLRWHLLTEEKVIRINGVRVFANPVDVAQMLPALAECRLYVPDAARASRAIAYQALAAELTAAGFPDIAYGVVEVEIPPRHTARRFAGPRANHAGEERT